jgi:hypothetical protein
MKVDKIPSPHDWKGGRHSRRTVPFHVFWSRHGATLLSLVLLFSPSFAQAQSQNSAGFPEFFRPFDSQSRPVDSTQGGSNEETYLARLQEAWKATLKLVSPHSQGSGVWVSQAGHFLTARHVIASDPAFPSNVKDEALFFSGKPVILAETYVPELILGISIQLLWMSSEAGDLALLRIVKISPEWKSTGPVNFPCVEAAIYTPAPKTPLWAFGFPVAWIEPRLGIEADGNQRMALRGTVLSDRWVLGGGSSSPALGEVGGTQDLLVSATATPGFSGGPILNEEGELIGLTILKESIASGLPAAGWTGIRVLGNLPDPVRIAMTCHLNSPGAAQPHGGGLTGQVTPAEPDPLDLATPPIPLTLKQSLEALLDNLQKSATGDKILNQPLLLGGFESNLLEKGAELLRTRSHEWESLCVEQIQKAHLGIFEADALPFGNPRGPVLWAMSALWVRSIVQVASQSERALDEEALPWLEKNLQRISKQVLLFGSFPNR